MNTRFRERAQLSVALVCSGAAALVYESTWGRMLQRVFGVSDWAIATVLAAFFLGMGLGSGLGGMLARRFDRPTRVYAALEVFVAFWALLSIVLVPRIHHAYATLGPDVGFATLTVVRFTLALGILLPPTIAMGATLPVLVRRFETQPSWQRDATWLYAVNTLGAAIGAGATGFFLLPVWGGRVAIMIAAGLSLLAAFIGWVGFGDARIPRAAPLRPVDDPAPHADAEPPLSVPLITGLAFASGFLALAGEVLFTRLLRIVVQGTSQAFAAMLVCYLVGITLGSVFVQRRGIGTPETALARFGWAQWVAAALVSIGIATAPWLPRLVGLARGEAELVPHELPVLMGIAIVTLLPLAIAVGTGLPCIVAMTELRGGSRIAGRVLAANTFGGLAGSILAGFVAVPTLGLEVSLYALSIAHATIALLALLTSAGTAIGRRLVRLGAVITVVSGTLVCRPTVDLPFLLDAWSNASSSIVEGPAGYDRSPLIFIREGRNTTVSVVDRDGVLRLFNDGRPESGISATAPYFGPELVMLGGLPALLAEKRERAMVIGLGAGHSATMLLAGGFEHVDVVELEPAVVEAARRIHQMRNQPFPLDDHAHVSLIVDDARARLGLARAGSYDAIVSQPSHPWLAGVSALYTQEFFEESSRALRPGGVLSLWVNVFRMDVAHLRSVVATLRSVFPHVAAFVVEDSSFLLVASGEPLAFGTRIGARLASAPRLRAHLAGYEIETSAPLLATLELDDAGIARFARGGSVLVDDRPALEYGLSALPHRDTLSKSELDVAFRAIPWITRTTQESLPPHLRETLPLYRFSQLEARRGALARVALALPTLAIGPSRRALVDGALAEMRGDVAGALAAYDRSGDPEAATRADSLRLIDGSPWQALAVARERTLVPHDATSLVRAAFVTGERHDFEFAASRAREAEDHAEPPYLRLATAFLDGGCAGALAVSVDASEIDPPTLAFLAECAASMGDRVRARRIEDERGLVRRALTQQWFDRGATASDGGNLALAILFYRRALATWPAHRDSAERLAEALCLLDRCPAASAVLADAIEAARFAPGQADTLRAAARRLEIELPP